jgi:hypothetical protein
MSRLPGERPPNEKNSAAKNNADILVLARCRVNDWRGPSHVPRPLLGTLNVAILPPSAHEVLQSKTVSAKPKIAE